MAVDLRELLESAGIERLREGRKQFHGLCPKHFERTGREDRHPSWSINKTTYAHGCWSCGYSGNLTGLLIDLTGAAPTDLEQTLHQESFLRRMVEERTKPQKALDQIRPLLTDWVLINIMRDVPERLLASRYLRRQAIDAYQVRWDGDSKQWVLPLRDSRGLLLGAQYRQKGAVFTLPEGMNKSELIFGYQQVSPFDSAVLVESPLDAVRLAGLGIPAFSTLGAWVSREQVGIMARLFSHVVIALDNDKAGHEAAEVVIPMLRRQGCPALQWDYTGLTDDEGRPAKDVGDVPHDDALLCAWDRTMRWGF
jgi:DNA primase